MVVTGCYAQSDPEVFTSMEGVHYVLGTSLKGKIPKFVGHDRGLSPQVLVEDLSAYRPFEDIPLSRFGNRTRPFLKIQDGCDGFCSYCIVPYTRGRSRSMEPEVVTNRISALKASGYSEVVLCGIHIGRYGQDLDPKTSLGELLHAIETIPGPPRVRLSSIEPGEVTAEMISHLSVSEKLCHHLHIPLQSADDRVLERMNRPYRSAFYEELIHHIITVVPDVSIGVDVLVGFPGETERAFDTTRRFIEKLPLSYLHVFPFSPRKGTAAEGLVGRVSPETTKKRARCLREVGQAKRKAFFRRFMGSTQEVLIEGKRDGPSGLLKGFTRNYIPVLVKGRDDLFHQVIQTRLVEMEDGRVFGSSARETGQTSLERSVFWQ
jgi:threonylcarbamoyladenosine tRNA methylthiotransferase MtaB